jgi:hypothetical protein
MDSGPHVRAVRRTAAQVEIDLLIPATLTCFPDHFPRLGILPGVLQIDWAIRLAREHLDVAGVFRGLRTVKFLHPILIDTMPTLTLARAPGELSFTYRLAEQVCSSGRALFGVRGPDAARGRE